MKNIFKILLITASAFALSSCKTVKIENGRIPAEYLEHAKKFMGIYDGSFDGRTGAIHLYLVGDIVKSKFIDGHNNDILGDDCESKIGLLKQITVSGSQNNSMIDNAHFEFNSGKCAYVMGRTLELYFSKSSDGNLKMHASILEKLDQIYVCPPSYPSGGNCHYESRNKFIDGNFIRK